MLPCPPVSFDLGGRRPPTVVRRAVIHNADMHDRIMGMLSSLEQVSSSCAVAGRGGA